MEHLRSMQTLMFKNFGLALNMSLTFQIILFPGRGCGAGGGRNGPEARGPGVPPGRVPRQPDPGQAGQGEDGGPRQGDRPRDPRPRHDDQVHLQ